MDVAEFNSKLAVIQQKLCDITKKQDRVTEKLELIKEQLQGSGRVANSPGINMKTFSDFPRFNGENPEMWIEKCHKFFLDNPMEDDEKVLMAARHMDGLANKWYKNHIEGEKNIKWAKFMELLLERFEPSNSTKLVRQLSKLHQKGTVDEYVKQFEQIRSAMFISYSEKYFLNFFVSGLREEISLMVDMVAPSTLEQAIRIARKQEDLLNAMAKMGLEQKRLTNNISGKWKGLIGIFLAVVFRLTWQIFVHSLGSHHDKAA